MQHKDEILKQLFQTTWESLERKRKRGQGCWGRLQAGRPAPYDADTAEIHEDDVTALFTRMKADKGIVVCVPTKTALQIHAEVHKAAKGFKALGVVRSVRTRAHSPALVRQRGGSRRGRGRRNVLTLGQEVAVKRAIPQPRIFSTLDFQY